MALGSSVYKLVFDTQGLDTLTATRKELNAVRAIMEESKTPLQRYAESWDRLNQLLNKELITVEAYNSELQKLRDDLPENIALKKQQAAAEELATKAANEALQQQQAITARAKQLDEQYMPVRKQAARDLAELRSHYQAGRVSVDSYRQGVLQLTAAQLTGVPIIGNLATSVANIGPAGFGAVAGLAAVGAAAAGTVSAIKLVADNIADQVGKIDDLITASQTIDIPVGQFQKLSYAADLADISASEFSGGMEKMLGSVSKAADGSAKLVRVFDMLGLDAGKLRDASPAETFEEITRAIDKVPNAADRVRAATAIFGSPDFLRVDVSHIESANKLFADLRGELTAVDVAKFNEMDDAIKEMNQTLDITWKKVAMEAVPAITQFAETATDVLVELNQSETFTDTIKSAADLLQGSVLVVRELKNEFDSFANSPAVQLLLKANDLNPLNLVNDAAGRAIGFVGSQIQDVGATARAADSVIATEQAGQQAGTGRFDATDTLDAHDELLEKLRQEVEYYGLTREEIELLKLAEQGASQAIRDQAQELASQAIELRRLDEAAQEAARAEEERAKTVERASAELMDAAEREAIAEMKKAEAARKSLDVLDEELEKREEILSLQNASTAMIKVGSREAFDLLARTQQNVASRAPAPFIVKPAEESLALAREANALLAAIAGKDSTVAVEEITV